MTKRGTGMKISDFMDLKMLQKIQDQFSDATGLAAIATDAEGNYITEGSNFTDFCMKYTRNSIEGARRCVKCDTECKGTYFCHAGLMDFSIDIMVGDNYLGKIIGGQVLPNEPDEDKFRELAVTFNVDPDEYIEALRQIPIKSEESIRASAKLLGDLVNMLVNFEYAKSKDKNSLNSFSTQLGKAIECIDDINAKCADLNKIENNQKILALNASIEAARAGEAGKGFAIVAGKVGDLAASSGTINNAIKKSVDSLSKVLNEMEENIG